MHRHGIRACWDWFCNCLILNYIQSDVRSFSSPETYCHFFLDYSGSLFSYRPTSLPAYRLPPAFRLPCLSLGRPSALGRFSLTVCLLFEGPVCPLFGGPVCLLFGGPVCPPVCLFARWLSCRRPFVRPVLALFRFYLSVRPRYAHFPQSGNKYVTFTEITWLADFGNGSFF